MANFDVETDVSIELKEPSLYSVMFLNDDYTPMDFVVELLIQVFGHTPEEAIIITQKVHVEGKGAAGIYSYEIAQAKQMDALTAAQQFEHPLRVVLEEN